MLNEIQQVKIIANGFEYVTQFSKKVALFTHLGGRRNLENEK